MIKHIHFILFISFGFAQEMQIKYVGLYTINYRWIKLETHIETIIAPGFLKKNYKTKPKNWIFKKNYNEKGEIWIKNSKYILQYDTKKKKYWLISPEKNSPLKNQEFDINIISKNPNLSTLFNLFKADESQPKIERIKDPNKKDINGFKAIKWTTKLSNSNNEIIFEEWIVNELPLITLLDSIQLELIQGFKKNYQIKKQNHNWLPIKFSSDNFIKKCNMISSINPLKGYIIKSKTIINNFPLKSINFEIKELYTIPFDASYFSIPEDYEHSKNNLN